MKTSTFRLSPSTVLFLVLFFPAGIFAGDTVVLFDGKSLDNWEVITCDVELQDGSLLLKAGNGLVQSEKQYADFVLEYEWKALSSEQYDSGMYFRYTEIPEGRPWPRRYQVNLRFDMMGDLGGFESGKNGVPVKAGDWNHFELTVKGATAALKVNGTPSWKVDGIEEPSGFIGIQAEVPKGGQFLFRNIKITELER
jgi:hypothetical protein